MGPYHHHPKTSQPAPKLQEPKGAKIGRQHHNPRPSKRRQKHPNKPAIKPSHLNRDQSSRHNSWPHLNLDRSCGFSFESYWYGGVEGDWVLDLGGGGEEGQVSLRLFLGKGVGSVIWGCLWSMLVRSRSSMIIRIKLSGLMLIRRMMRFIKCSGTKRQLSSLTRLIWSHHNIKTGK